MLIAMSVYTYLRLIVDHGAPNLLPLRQKEVDFCISMLREKVRMGEGCTWRLSAGSGLLTQTLSIVYGLSDHRERSGSPAAECCSNPRDGAGVERLAAQPTSPQSSVYR